MVVTAVLQYAWTLKYLSGFANAAVLMVWFWRRLNIHYFLEGRWEGILDREGSADLAYEVKFIVARHKNQRNSGILVYEIRSRKQNLLLFSGVDKLQEYEPVGIFCWSHSFDASFDRQFHVVHKEGRAKIGQAKVYIDAQKFQYTCTVRHLWWAPEFEITGHIDGKRIEGRLTKIASN